MTRHAEPAAASRNSSTEASKLGDAKWRTRDPSSGVILARNSSRTARNPECGTRTPFGRPVEPEV
ncbi:Uncharacterised protein [Mycobacteroides abscessus subsp. abscessus]|nr:Uncharacterised protein [Mycobacteroides abscessus subsp. abscessus]